MDFDSNVVGVYPGMQGQAAMYRNALAPQPIASPTDRLNAREREFGAISQGGTTGFDLGIAMSGGRNALAERWGKRPGNWYHYTRAEEDFPAFKVGQHGMVYLSDTPEGALLGGRVGGAAFQSGGRRILPLVTNAKKTFGEIPPPINPARIEDPAVRATANQLLKDWQRTVREQRRKNMANPDEYDIHFLDAEDPATHAALKAMGYDSVRIHDESGRALAVFNPNSLRSPWARFDPRNYGSANLLASGGAGLALTQE